jgi:N-acyl-phosphatidylethanolamine-hydrolysing phospholipase D
LGLKELFVDVGINPNNVFEFDWDDEKSYKSTKIKAFPSQHWSARGLFDKRKTLWASWYIGMEDFNFWFAGDTGYNDVQFKQIGDAIQSLDLAFIPIGAYVPRWFMKYYHVNSNEAVKIHQDVHAKKSIGMHWGTFPLTAEEPIDPKTKLEIELEKQKIQKDEFITMKIGESLEL